MSEELNEQEIKQENKEVSDIETAPQWYVANTYSGRERIVADYLEKRKISMHLENEIFRIVVAEKTVPVIDKKTGKPKILKTGEQKTKVENLYPGYIFVEAIMTDIAWYVIRNTPGVTGIVGSSGSGTKPFPLPREDMMPILKAMNLITTEVRTDYTIGEQVKILEGAFADEQGQIISIDGENNKAEVSVVFFGRPTNITVDFADIEKID